jgi:hypothetical protein
MTEAAGSAGAGAVVLHRHRLARPGRACRGVPRGVYDGSCQPQQQADDDHRSAVVDRPLVEAGGDAAPLPEPVHAPLNHVPLPVTDRVKGGWPPRPATLVDPGRDGVADAATTQQPPAGPIAVAAIGEQMVRRLRGRPRRPGRGIRMPSSSGWSWVLSWRCPPVRVTASGRPLPSTAKCSLVVSPPRCAQRLILRVRPPPLRSARLGWWRAPAACWWARTTLASTLIVHSTSPTASELVWAWANSRSQVPSRRQRT